MYRSLLLSLLCLQSSWLPQGQAAEAAKLPPPVARAVDFAKEIKPLLEESCVKCHAKGKEKGGLSLETRASFLKGGETGTAAEVGHSADSLIVQLVAGLDPDSIMPKKGNRWTPEQIGLLRAWIDQGAVWPKEITFARPPARNLQPRVVTLPAGGEGNPIDRLLAAYFAQHPLPDAAPVEDRQFIRRVSLDAVGLLPAPEQVEAFVADGNPGKRAELIWRLLGDRRAYADHWLSFWNDMLRNDYRGTGFIDGGRKQVTEWLYTSLLANKPYDQFVRELMNPGDKSEGFTAGIIWRGTVNASMSPPMQAAQSVSQVFLGINLKCASCHDSFVSDWTLADAFGMAAVFANEPLELVRCDKPQGQKAALRFLYPEVGALDAAAPRAERMQKLAALMTEPKNGRLSRTIVNRLWARLLGRGLVEPIDDMDKPSWNADLLDWLANDLEANHFDLKHTIELILTSRAYSLPAVELAIEKEEYVFRGPLVRRLSAEQFADAVSSLTGAWAPLPATLEFDFTGGGAAGSFTLPQWIWTTEPMSLAAERNAQRNVAAKEAAAKKAAEASQRKIEQNAPEPELEAARKAAEKAEAELAAMKTWAETQHGEIRHRVIFRKTFHLPAKPERAYAALLASQGFDVAVNGALVKPKMADGFRNGRSRLYDFTAALKAGENVIAVSIDSHTEKQMNETERRQFPESVQHFNQQSGLACYLGARTGGRLVEIISDGTWRAERAPEGDWMSPHLADAAWAAAEPLPEGVAPVDEGPGQEPIRRKDFANQPAELGPALRAVCSTAALAQNIRASMLAADPLQVALDRPNREIVITARANTATTLQGLELTNGNTLATRFNTAAAALAKSAPAPEACAESLYRQALGRPPAEAEKAVALEVLGRPVSAPGIADLLWAITMLPEFQFIR